MLKYEKVAQLVEEAYKDSAIEIAHWMWENHVQVVARKAQELCQRHRANPDFAVAGALLHDFGDVFVDRHSQEHDVVTVAEATKVLMDSGYTEQEVQIIMDTVIEPHGCQEGNMPETLDGKVLATADAYAHLSTDFYLKFAWMHIPQNTSYKEFLVWARKKIERDFNRKIQFSEVRQELEPRYKALHEILHAPHELQG